MISKRSRDIENWSNDEENSVLHHRNNITFYNIKIKNVLLLFVIFHYIAFFFYFSLDKQKIISKSLIIVMFPNFWQVL